MSNIILSTLKRVYQILTMIYFDYIRDTIIAVSRVCRKKNKALILDMDWCWWCFNEQEIRTNLHQHPALKQYADFIRVDREQIFKGKGCSPEVTYENFRSIAHDGYNLWGICKATIISDLGTYDIDPENTEHANDIQKKYNEAVRGIDNLKKLFDRLDPDTVFVCGGGVFDSRCVVEVARRRGINVVGAENFMMGGFVIFDNLSGQIINRHSLARMGSDILEAWEVTDAERKEIFELWRRKLTEKAEEHKTGGIDKADDIKKALDLPRGCKTLLLLGQVRTDASIVLDSPLYEDPVDMIEAVARCMKKSENTVLIVRLHPKEFKGKAPNGKPYDRSTYRSLIERGIDKLPNVKIVEDPGYNTYTLMEMADAGITINSQAGLEMCMLGKPVMVCGAAFYGNKGFTVDLGHPAALETTIDFLLKKNKLSECEHQRALNFMHFICKRQLFDRKLSINTDRLLQIFNLIVIARSEATKQSQ